MSYIGQQPADRILTSADISDAAITADKLASSSVTQPKVATGVAGSGPAFSAYQSSAQTLSSSTNTKILFQTEEWDTNNNFSSSTFTPTVAGYYQINSAIRLNSSYSGGRLMLYKNGSLIKTGSDSGSATVAVFSLSSTVYCNGTTDYIDIYALIGTGQALSSAAWDTWVNGCLVRSA